MPNITYHWTPNPLLIADEFARAAAGVAEISEPLEFARFHLIADIERHFESETDPAGKKWAPLDPEWRKRKEAMGKDKILVLSDDMHRAAVDPASYPIEGGTGAATLEANMANFPDYSIYHQEGRGDPSKWGALADARARYKAEAYDKGEYKEIVSAIGGQGRGRSLPQRAFLGLSPQAEVAILRGFNQWLEEVLEESLLTAENIGFSAAGSGPIIGHTASGQPMIRIPGVGVRFARK